MAKKEIDANKDKTKVTHIGSGIDFGGFISNSIKAEHSVFLKRKSPKLHGNPAWLKKPERHPGKRNCYLNPIIRGIGNFYRISKEQCPTL